MKRVDGYNLGALALALLASISAAASVHRDTDLRVEQLKPQASAVEEIALPSGERALRDAAQAIVPLRRYQRIASASLPADRLLLELCEPERIIAVTRLSKENPRAGFRYGTRAGIDWPTDLESILALHPDLLVTNHFGDPRYAARLREHGIQVFDLGDMGGLDTLLATIHTLGKLTSTGARAAALAQRVTRGLEAIAAEVPASARPRGLYLSSYGKQLYGGATGTSYHDVLVYAGLVDLAAERYHGWPALDAEQVLSLDPEWLVTRTGMAAQLCHAPGLERLRPCRGEGHIAELDATLADDPGLAMLELAEDLRQQVHGPRRSAR